MLRLFWIRSRACSSIPDPNNTHTCTKHAGKHTCALPTHPRSRPEPKQHTQQKQTHVVWGAWGRANGLDGCGAVLCYGGAQKEDMKVPQWSDNEIVLKHRKPGQMPTYREPHQKSKTKKRQRVKSANERYNSDPTHIMIQGTEKCRDKRRKKHSRAF